MRAPACPIHTNRFPDGDGRFRVQVQRSGADGQRWRRLGLGGILLAIAVVCMGAPAVRLLISAVRERREVELWLGLAMGIGSLGLPLRFISGIEITQSINQGVAISDRVGALSAAGHSMTSLASVFLYLFVWRVFHPGNVRIRNTLLVLFVGIAGCLAWVLMSGAHLIERDASVIAGNLLRGLAFPWCAFESIRYWKMMKRRVALGIGDPVVANRFALWGLWTGIFSSLPLLVILAKIIAQVSGDSSGTLEMMLPMLRLAMLCGASAAFLCVWLSFYPPESYLDRLRRSGAFQPTG
jgi:hypothetical protein